ncbi:hypothetical protein ACPPVQ_00750 [Diaminobutyricibacter sp. McL0618]|uniref:hypothetical protein n=1 Tax=Leifsonia sp. McL0618 TaxID=3415677 RepID=UPI003CEB8505
MELVETEFIMAGLETPPWEIPGAQFGYVETGRQALALLADELASDGHRTLLAPDYLCDTMISPFVTRGWSVTGYRMTSALDIDHSDLLAHAHAQVGPFTVLLGLYFGREPDNAYRALVDELHHIGARVIDDETHRVLRPRNSGADFAIGSLRKTLPLADGAYVRSFGNQDFSIGPVRPDSRRWAAMDEKRRYLDGELKEKTFKTLFREANTELEADDLARAIGARTREGIGHLDYEQLRKSRVSNALVLDAELERLHITRLNPPGPTLIPSHLVISVDNAAAVQHRMAEMGVYCPIHWPRSELLTDLGSWPSTYLSLPVDHRYDATDMLRIAFSLVEATS